MWISSFLVSTVTEMVCIQRVYANSKWVGARGLPHRSGPLVLLMPATQTAVKDKSDSTWL